MRNYDPIKAKAYREKRKSILKEQQRKFDNTCSSGVYMITDTITGERYIGSSKRIESRWR